MQTECGPVGIPAGAGHPNGKGDRRIPIAATRVLTAGQKGTKKFFSMNKFHTDEIHSSRHPPPGKRIVAMGVPPHLLPDRARWERFKEDHPELGSAIHIAAIPEREFVESHADGEAGSRCSWPPPSPIPSWKTATPITRRMASRRWNGKI
jgi:hypothetical protein